MDLSQFASVVDFANRFERDGGRLDILVMNAGVAPLAKLYMKALNEKEVKEKDVPSLADEIEAVRRFASLYINALSRQMGQVVCTSAVLFMYAQPA